MKGEGGNSIPKGPAAGRSMRAKKDWMERARTYGSTWRGCAPLDLPACGKEILSGRGKRSPGRRRRWLGPGWGRGEDKDPGFPPSGPGDWIRRW